MRALPSLNCLKVFEAAGEYLNFTVAARHLHVTQGAVSRQIHQLEEFLGVSLFTRHAGKLSLSEPGQRLLKVIQGSLADIEREISQISSPNLKQRLNILAPPTMASRWLGPRLGSFSLLYPQYELQLYTEAEEGVSFDVSLSFETFDPESKQSCLLFMEQIIAVCNKNLLKDCEDLENNSHKMLHVRHRGDPLPSWSEWLKSAKFIEPEKLSQGITMSTQEQVINAAIAGCGFAVVDTNMVKWSLKSGALVQFHPLQIRSQFGYFLKVPNSKQGLAKVEDFCLWLKDKALTLF